MLEVPILDHTLLLRTAVLPEQIIEQIIAYITRVADQQHALEGRLREGLQEIDQIATFPRFGCPQVPGPEYPRGQADQGNQLKRGCRLALGFAQALFQLLGAGTFQSRTVTAQGKPTFHGHTVVQEMEDRRPHGIAECPPDGHGQTEHRLAEAGEAFARSLSLGAVDLNIEGSGHHKTLRVGIPCTS